MGKNIKRFTLLKKKKLGLKEQSSPTQEQEQNHSFLDKTKIITKKSSEVSNNESSQNNARSRLSHIISMQRITNKNGNQVKKSSQALFQPGMSKNHH